MIVDSQQGQSKDESEGKDEVESPEKGVPMLSVLALMDDVEVVE